MLVGFTKQQVSYHIGDAILIQTTEAADIGLITSFSEDVNDIVVRLFGRMNDVVKRVSNLSATIHEVCPNLSRRIDLISL